MIEKQLRFSVIHSRRHLYRSEGGKQEPSCSEMMRNIAKLYGLALKTHPKSTRHLLMPKAFVTFFLVLSIESIILSSTSLDFPEAELVR